MHRAKTESVDFIAETDLDAQRWLTKLNAMILQSNERLVTLKKGSDVRIVTAHAAHHMRLTLTSTLDIAWIPKQVSSTIGLILSVCPSFLCLK
jgi:hypothetical protein